MSAPIYQNDNPHTFLHLKLVADSLYLAAVNQLSYDEALSTIQYLANETDPVPWSSAFSNFYHILTRCNADQAVLFKVNRF